MKKASQMYSAGRGGGGRGGGGGGRAALYFRLSLHHLSLSLTLSVCLPCSPSLSNFCSSSLCVSISIFLYFCLTDYLISPISFLLSVLPLCISLSLSLSLSLCLCLCLFSISLFSGQRALRLKLNGFHFKVNEKKSFLFTSNGGE